MNRNLSGQSIEKNVLAQTNERTCLLRSQKNKKLCVILPSRLNLSQFWIFI